MIIEYLNRVRNLKTMKSRGLSPREYQTLMLMINGFSHREMAEVLDCGEKTVQKHTVAVAMKIRSTEPPGPTQIQNSVTYAKWAIRNGYITIEDWLAVSYSSPFNLPKGWKT